MVKHRNVYIIGPTYQIEHIFPRYGYTPWVEATVDEAPSIDMLCWMGGSDISPELYGQKQLPITTCTPHRDKREVDLHRRFKGKPKLGICRGAQLLCVLNGGSMYQDCDNHAGPNHEVTTEKGEKIVVCSVHHQLMIPPKNAHMIAWCQKSTYRIDEHGEHFRKDDEVDPEAFYIPEDNALCFQAHPEFGPRSCTDYFFNLVEEYIR